MVSDGTGSHWEHISAVRLFTPGLVRFFPSVFLSIVAGMVVFFQCSVYARNMPSAGLPVKFVSRRRFDAGGIVQMI